jgi:hypothetical protein
MIWVKPSVLLEERAAESELPCFRKFKYLSYLPRPIQLPTSEYDLVEDDEFCCPDDRLPILLLTQYGIFPKPASFPSKCGRDYPTRDGLEGQWIGLIRRAYLTNREQPGISLIPPDRAFIFQQSAL